MNQGIGTDPLDFRTSRTAAHPPSDGYKRWVDESLRRLRLGATNLPQIRGVL
jgi:hypothetical protein